jgi:thiamine pyrophosphokinase
MFDTSLIQQVIGHGSDPAEKAACALVVSGSPRGVAPQLVSPLAEAAAFVMAVDSGAESVRAAGVVPDLLLGDFDSIGHETLACCRDAKVELVTHKSYKDETDLELALVELRRRGFRTVLATNALGGRVDHELAALGSLAAAADEGMTVAVVEAGEVCVFLSAAGGHAALRLDVSGKRRPAYISLIPWGGEANASISGVEWELDHATLAPCSSRTISNVPTANQVTVEVHAGTLIVVLELPEGS